MRSRRMKYGFLGLALCSMPLSASAANVIIVPASHAAPLMSPLGLCLLMIAAVSLGVYRLRHRSVGASLGLAALVLGCLIGVGVHADPRYSELQVQGADCLKRTVFEFGTNEYDVLRSECSNNIVVESVDADCNDPTLQGDNLDAPAPEGSCTSGRVLAPNEACFLPGCN